MKFLNLKTKWILLPAIILFAGVMIFNFNARITQSLDEGSDEKKHEDVPVVLARDNGDIRSTARNLGQLTTTAKNAHESGFTDHPEPDTTPKSQNLVTARELLDRMETEHQWTLAERRANVGIWVEPCMRVFGATNASNATSSLSDSDSIAFRIQADLSTFCGDLPLQAELDILDSMLEGDRSVAEERMMRRKELEDALSIGNERLVRTVLFRSIRNALFRMDESGLHDPLWELVTRNIIDPPFPDAGSREIYLQLIEPVSVSLICWYQGGCTGTRNPFVLRVCFVAYARSGLYCQDPGSIDEAIWQTLTPIHYQAYQRFLSEVVAGLSIE